MNTNDHVQLTQEGYDEIVMELKKLKEEKLPAAIDRVAVARSFGDLSENAEYHSAREDLAFIEGKIQELETIISQAQVIAAPTKSKKSIKTVELGTKVTIKNKKTEHTYHIVGEWEANPLEKKISHESPLGKALLGKTTGDEVEIEAPAGMIKYSVVSVD